MEGVYFIPLLFRYTLIPADVKSERFKRRIEDEQAKGWEIEEDGDRRVVLWKPTRGSTIIHSILFILTGWYTFGAINYLYYKYSRSNAPRKPIRDQEAYDEGEPTADLSPDPSFTEWVDEKVEEIDERVEEWEENGSPWEDDDDGEDDTPSAEAK